MLTACTPCPTQAQFLRVSRFVLSSRSTSAISPARVVRVRVMAPAQAQVGAKSVPTVTSAPRPILLRVEDAADALSISRTTLYGLIRSGDLRVVRIGRCVRVRTADLEGWVQAASERTG